MSDLIKTLANLANMEQTHASSLSNSATDVKNVIVQGILSGIAFDSHKHAKFYQAILSLLQQSGAALNEDDYNQIATAIQKHIETEERMISEAKTMLDSLPDKRIQHLLTEIYNDEVKHHALMTRILEAVIRREAIFEEDWWDAIWQDVPFHGSPGG
jgi:rubrerythrin